LYGRLLYGISHNTSSAATYTPFPETHVDDPLTLSAIMLAMVYYHDFLKVAESVNQHGSALSRSRNTPGICFLSVGNEVPERMPVRSYRGNTFSIINLSSCVSSGTPTSPLVPPPYLHTRKLNHHFHRITLIPTTHPILTFLKFSFFTSSTAVDLQLRQLSKRCLKRSFFSCIYCNLSFTHGFPLKSHTYHTNSMSSTQIIVLDSVLCIYISPCCRTHSQAY
jgi:hypothetical protein